MVLHLGVVIALLARTPPEGETHDQLRVRDLATGKEKVLVLLAGTGHVLSWSPDGSLLAVAREGEAGWWLVVEPEEPRWWRVVPCVKGTHQSGRAGGEALFRWRRDATGFVVGVLGGRDLASCSLAGVRRTLVTKVDLSASALATEVDMVAELRDSRWASGAYEPWQGTAPHMVLHLFEGEARQVKLPMPIGQFRVSPDGRWYGGLDETDSGVVPDVVLVEVASGAVRRLGTFHGVGLTWSSTRPTEVGARALVVRALGSGRPVRARMALDLTGSP